MTRRLAAAAALTCAACTSTPPADAPPLTGSYVAEHEVIVYDGTDWTPQPATDQLAVVPRGDSLDVSFVLLHTNAHICEWHGTMGREGDEWVSREVLEYVGERPECAMTLHVSADSLTLGDAGAVCRRAYCGARGTIDGIGFARTTRTADVSWRDGLR
ncbi:MAG TPA: hypothetical protein EYQ24_03280 [Bacteroidetes bacterium]|nr:hypothetical protein [Bacteroidota bacterium]HIL56927.1 hypothetical protein [Rhodothermales bacterium]